MTHVLFLKQQNGSRYGNLPLKSINKEKKPWDTVDTDSGGPRDFIDHTGKERVLTALTIVEPFTGLFEIYRIRNSTSLGPSQLFDMNFLCRFPNPHEVICDQGSEFKLKFKELCETQNVTRVPSSRCDPQRNSIIEIMHLVL